MTSAAAYAFPGARVAVRCEVSGFDGWLAEMLAPGFDCVTPRSTDVSVVVGGPPDADLPTRDGVPLGPLPCFALDREVVSHPARRIGDAVEITDAKFGARYVLRTDSVEVHPVGTWPRTRVAAFRVVRELASAQALADGRRIQLHAAAIEDDGKVVLFAGPKESGKTTLLAHVGSTTGVAVVANDRVLVSPPERGSHRWEARPVATIVSVRPGTREMLRHLFHEIPAVESPAHLTLAEADLAPTIEGSGSPPTRLKLSPAQLARALGARLSRGGAVTRIALVVVDEDLAGFALRPVDPDEGGQRLAAVRYGTGDIDRPRTVFERFLGVDRPASSDAIVTRRLSTELSCVELRVGAGFFQSSAAAGELVDQLLAPE